jgi:hypothetical protein
MAHRKLDLIRALMPRIPAEYQQSIDDAMSTWWVNIRRDGGMRLSNLGYKMLHDVLQLESWQLHLADHDGQIFTKRLVLDLDRKLQWPYYIEISVKKKRRRIVFFGSKEAMMATMYGDLERWLASLG